MTNETAIQPYEYIKAVMKREDVISEFAKVLGGDRGAFGYISSVLTAVSDNDKLLECSPKSILKSAMRAATMGLSVDPSTGHAYLVPYKGICTFQPGYKGIYQIAIRTNKYRYINAGKLYEGQEMIEDQLTGAHHIEGRRESDEVIGYFCSFELLNRVSHVLYMTVEEIQAHAKRYAPSYEYKTSLWKKDFPAMAKKTVMRLNLTRWGYLDPVDKAELERGEDIVSDDERFNFIDDGKLADAKEFENESSVMATLGFVDEVDGATVRQVDAETGEVIEGQAELGI